MHRLIDANSVLEDEHEKLYEDYDILRDRHFEQSGFECCQQTIVNASTILTIPEHSTNGDMIKAMFPNLKYEIIETAYNVGLRTLGLYLKIMSENKDEIAEYIANVIIEKYSKKLIVEVGKKWQGKL